VASPGPFSALLAEGGERAAVRARTAAEAAYREAAALRPSDPAPHLLLAQLYLEWNRPQEGLEAAAAAERLGGPAALVESLRAALYAAQGDWEAAVVHGEAALALAPDDTATRHLVAQGCVALGRQEEALAHYRALLEADPADRQARERLGALLALSDPTAASPHLRAASTPLASDLLVALEETAGSDPAHRLARLGQTCLAHGEPALAALALERAVADSPAYADAHALLGQALDQLGRPDDGLGHLRRAVGLAPGSPLARSLLGLHYLKAGDPAAARPHLEAAYDLDPGNPALSLYLALVYADLGQYGVADLWLDEATRLAPEDPTVWEAVVRFYLDRRMGEEGLEAAWVLVGLAPASATARDLLGWACFLAGSPAEAEEHLRRALDLDPTLPSAHYHLGRVYTYLGRVEEARTALGRAFDLSTDPALRARVEEALSALP